VVFPLVLLGLLGLRGEWLTSREYLNELVEQQARLSAAVFERWVDAQQQPLVTLAAAAEEDPGRRDLQRELRFIMAPRPNWVDVRVIDWSGKTMALAPTNAEALSTSLFDKLNLNEQGRPVVETKWADPAGRAVIGIAVRTKSGGAVIARVDANAMNELFRDLKLPEHAILTLNDEQNRIIYRSHSMEAYVGADVGGSNLFGPLNGEPTSVVEVVSPVDGTKRIYGLARAGATHYTATVGVPSAVLYEPAWRQVTRYLLLSLLALMCTGGAAVVIARGIALPLRRLRKAAHRFGAGDMKARSPLGGVREVSELSDTFNAMATQISEREERLAEIDRLKSEFVSGVSHELRTPLTTIKTLTRVLLRSGTSESERRKYLETIASQCDRQIDLVLNLLDLSRIESGALELELAPLDTTDLVRSCVKIERPAAELRNLVLEPEITGTRPLVAADRNALRRAVCSLIENAIKYSPDSGRIIVSASERDDEVTISVTDNGRGIASSDLPHIFEKFYRGRTQVGSDSPNSINEAAHQASYQPEGPGVGLGLYLADKLIKRMKGRISVESEPGRGSRFTVHLPVWRDAQESRTTVIEEMRNGKAVAYGG
jgi:signal transduction histidine kinase